MNNNKIQFSRIVFPSDNLTIKTLRRIHPQGFDAEAESSFFRIKDDGSLAADVISDMLYAERALAESAFNRSIGLPPPDAMGLERQFHDSLVSLYRKYTIATGEHHGKELIRDIESQAVEQARAHLGRQS